LSIAGNRTYIVTTLGSIEGEGTYELSGAELQTGSLNTDTTVSGPIIDVPSTSLGGMLTKVGTGTLTLAGTNTYTGLTKVNGGTLAINGSTPGNVQINSSGTLKGTGTIGGTVTVNAGGVLAPGTSAGTITVGGLVMTPSSTLGFEIGGTAAGSFDQILSAGSLAFDGTLQISLINSFAPALGQTFNLLDWGSTTGTFDALQLPSLGGGLGWNTSQLYTTGVLSVGTGTSGDFDFDGDVDGRDFLAWQRGGSPNGTPGGPVSASDLADWQANYGLPLTAVSTAVPEPGGMALLVSGLLAGLGSRGRWGLLVG
jgi:autotransporter-associated beta strand protein